MNRRQFIALPVAVLAPPPAPQLFEFTFDRTFQTTAPGVYEWIRAELVRQKLQVWARKDWQDFILAGLAR